MDRDKFRLVIAIMIGAFLIFLAIMMLQKNDREERLYERGRPKLIIR